MKKNLQVSALAIALGFATVTAQTGSKGTPRPFIKPNGTSSDEVRFPNRGCATGVPSAEWEAQFQKQIAEFVQGQNQNNPAGKTQMVNYTIPVIIHVIHGGQAVGTYPNLQQGQLNSQVAVLNADYGGTGFNAGNYPATAFTNWATTASLPAANKDGSGRVKIANTGIQFCLATKDTTGASLTEPGIHRVNYNSLTIPSASAAAYPSKNPASYSTQSSFQAFIDNIVKPQTVWNVSKYLNIWVTDENVGSVGLLGYATFPVLSGLTGIPGGTGTSNTDGFWAYAKAFGSNTIFPGGTYDPTYNKGRTCTHEIGHWVGLRHIGGDVTGGCGTDYCADTPPNKACTGTCGNGFGQNYGNPTYPFHANQCAGPPANVDGDMFMNFMDYTDDVAMYMFTTDQTTRIQTAMANSPYRKFLGTHGLCTVSSSSATAAFTMTNSACTGSAVTVTNNSTGSPTPTFTWSSSPAGAVFNPNANAASPTITFPSAGAYTITLTASNGTVSTAMNSINITTCTAPTSSCNDTLSNFDVTLDTLVLYRTSAGYVAGNNQYGDKEKAEAYSSTGLVSNAKIVGGIVLFYRHATANIGTKGSGNVVFKVYNGTAATGPSGTAINTYTATLTSILASATATTNVPYCGNPSVGYSSAIIRPYSFNFTAPTTITGDFLMGVQLPTTTGDTVAIFQNLDYASRTIATAWEQWSDNSWNDFNSSWGSNASLAILPKIACVTDVINMNGISGNIAIFPNPSNGVFNFAVTMPKSSDLSFTVVNNIGQVVYTKTEKGVTNSIINMDLSHLAKGIYSVNIIDSTGDKITRKIIIQ